MAEGGNDVRTDLRNTQREDAERIQLVPDKDERRVFAKAA
jgi:hypothetical protein